jgi:hypothetical protein
MLHSAFETCGVVGRKALFSLEEQEMAASRLWLTKGTTWGIEEVTAEVVALREAKIREARNESDERGECMP